MPNELHVVPLVALLNAVHTDGVAVCCVAGVTPVERALGAVSSSSGGFVQQGEGGWTGRFLPVKIVHWIAGVTGNLVQALTSAHSFLNGILIVHYFVIWGRQEWVGSCTGY